MSNRRLFTFERLSEATVSHDLCSLHRRRPPFNGHYWGIYINVQQIDAELIEEDGARYKAVHGSLEWLGTNLVFYHLLMNWKEEDSFGTL